ncbi:MAG: hypothetical protein PVF58_04095 [Candidatus Methanofastidiosia archaeon]
MRMGNYIIESAIELLLESSFHEQKDSDKVSTTKKGDNHEN